MAKPRGRLCAATNCHNYVYRRKDLAFFRFPANPERSRQWVINSRKRSLSNKTHEQLHKCECLCSDHFELSQFTNDLRKQLVPGALPTLFDVPNPPPRLLPVRKLPLRKDKQEVVTPSEKVTFIHSPCISLLKTTKPAVSILKRLPIPIPCGTPAKYVPPASLSTVSLPFSMSLSCATPLTPAKSLKPMVSLLKRVPIPTACGTPAKDVPPASLSTVSLPLLTSLSCATPLTPAKDVLSASPSTVSLPLVPVSLPSYATPLAAAESSNLAATADTPRKRSLRKAVEKYRRRSIRAKNKLQNVESAGRVQKAKCINMIGKFLSGASLNFVKTQINMAGRHAKGHRWLESDKSMALSLYHSSPKTYHLLRKLFSLPSKSTLKSCLANINVYPGFTTTIVDSFKHRVNSMSEDNTKCAVIFDEMVLKSGISYNASTDNLEGVEDLGPLLGKTKCSATHALVFMVRGLKEKWKQPLGYFLTGSTIKPEVLKTLLCKAIDVALSVGLKPRAVICDQGANNQSCMKMLGVDVVQPYFYHNHERIVVWWDPPHLIKNIRNNLKRNGFSVGVKSVSWDHIVAFHKADCQLPRRLAPKLTEKHIAVPGFSSMRVRLATQVLSHSVSTGIMLLSSIGRLPEEAQHTAEFCENFDKLFNIFNSMTLKSTKPYAHAISETSSHWQFLEKMKAYISTVKPLNRASLPCINGWLHNINAVPLLFSDLGFSFLLTNRLNQDCLENLFSQIRSKGGSSDNPNAVQFRAAFRNCMVESLTRSVSNGNCEGDVDQFLLNLGSFSSANCVVSSPPQTLSTSSSVSPISSTAARVPSFVIDDHCYSHLSDNLDQLAVTNSNIDAFIAGYIGFKLSKTLCESCKLNISLQPDSELLVNAEYSHCKLKSHTAPGEKGSLFFPTPALVELVREAELSYTKVIDSLVHSNNIMSNLVNQLLVSNHQVPNLTCCNLGEKCIRLYAKVRLHHSLKLVNRELAQSRRCKNRKLLKLSHL